MQLMERIRPESDDRGTTDKPYQTTAAESQVARHDAIFRKMAILLLLTGPMSLAMSGVQSKLLGAGIINTKDLSPLVGNETGTLSEYLLNVWHWDAVIFVLYLATIPSVVVAVWLLRSRPITMP
jgi:hypothetical protein